MKAPEPEATHHVLWQLLVTEDDMGELNAVADNEIKFRTLAKHFWNRAFLFQRRWLQEHQDWVIERVLRGISVRDKGRLGGILEDTLLEAEETLSRTVRRFAHYWLTGTTAGQKYSKAYERYRYVGFFIII